MKRDFQPTVRRVDPYPAVINLSASFADHRGSFLGHGILLTESSFRLPNSINIKKALARRSAYQ